MTNTLFKIITLGCKVNQYESAYLKESLGRKGWREASPNERADVTVINTCIVTLRATQQSRQAIRKAIRENPVGKVAAIGCYAQVFPEELSRIRGVNLIAGNTVKGQLPDILTEGMDSGGLRLVAERFDPQRAFEFLPVKGLSGRARAFLKIQDGCQSFCSYCIVPHARGPLRSLDPSKILHMLRSLSNEGYQEVVLTGIHLGKYGVDLDSGTTLKGLLHSIGDAGLPLRIRLSSMEPNEIDDELIDMVVSEDWLCPHFHIPLQSGDDAILARMNRNYSARVFARLVEDIHRRIPLAAIGVDAMAGFPGEDYQAYQNTYSLIEDLPISYLHVFPFSARKGTAAASFSDQVEQDVIKERAAKLRALGHEKRQLFYRACLGRGFFVLAEGWESEERRMMKGTTDNYIPVVFPSPEDLRGRLVSVRLKGLERGRVLGKVRIDDSRSWSRCAHGRSRGITQKPLFDIE